MLRSQVLVVLSVSICSLGLLPQDTFAVTLGQLDDFQGGTTQGWVEGISSPNPPTVIFGGGPAGAGDNYLQNVSTTGFGSGSRMVMFNNSQWTGNYTGAGVNAITADLNNLAGNAMSIRMSIKGAGGAFSTTSSFALPSASGWASAVFTLKPTDFTAVSGVNAPLGFDLGLTLSTVDELRILSSTNPAWAGDVMTATLGVDNIQARFLDPADTDMDFDVDTADLTTMFQNFNGAGGSGKTMAQGDTDGDGDVDTADITTGFQNFTGALAGLANNPDIIYDPSSGNVKIYADGANIGSFNLQSAGQFTPPADFSDLAADTGFPSGPTDNTASAIGWVSGGSLFGVGFDGPAGSTNTPFADMGNIFPTGLDETGLAALLTNKAWAAPIGGGPGGNFDLVVQVPEPSGLVLVMLGMAVANLVRYSPRLLGRVLG